MHFLKSFHVTDFLKGFLLVCLMILELGLWRRDSLPFVDGGNALPKYSQVRPGTLLWLQSLWCLLPDETYAWWAISLSPIVASALLECPIRPCFPSCWENVCSVGNDTDLSINQFMYPIFPLSRVFSGKFILFLKVDHFLFTQLDLSYNKL